MAAALDGMRKCTLLPDFDAKAAAAAEFQAEDGTAEGADGSEESGENSGEALAEPDPLIDEAEPDPNPDPDAESLHL